MRIIGFVFLLTISLFLFCTLAAKSSNTDVGVGENKVLFRNNLGQPINVVQAFKDGVLYSSNNQLYYNLEKVSLVSSNDDDNFQINNIIVDKKDFYLTTSVGVYQNFRKIFAKEPCYHLIKTSKRIWLSCYSGIYSSDLSNDKSLYDYHWELDTSSPQQTRYFGLNANKSKPKYASSPFGFYYFDTRKKQWQRRLSNKISTNLAGEFTFGQFWIEPIANKEVIYLPHNQGVAISTDQGKTFQNSQTGLETDIDGFYNINRIIKFNNKLFLVSNTGLYVSDIKLSPQWQKLSINELRKEENQKNSFLSINEDQSNNRLLISSSQGEIISVKPGQEETSEPIPQEQADDTATSEPEKLPKDLLLSILNIEPNIQEVHRVALDFAGIPVGKDYNSYRRNAKLRNLAPNLEAFLEKNNQNYLSIETQDKDSFSSNNSSLTSSSDNLNVNRGNDQYNTGLRFKWNLGDALFDSEITNINNSARLSVNIRENLLTEVTQAYYNRKELLFNTLKELLERQDDDFIKQHLALEESLAQLDARTGAWYSKQLKYNLEKHFKNLNGSDFLIKELYASI